MGIRYPIRQDDEWHRPIMEGYRMACCDCGLIHEVDFRIVDGHVEMRARRNERATSAKRRHMPNVKQVG